MRLATRRSVDLAVVVALALLAIVAALTLAEGSPLRVALGLPFLLLAPGYALLAALFPEGHAVTRVAKGEDGETTEEVTRGLEPLERFALSLGLSIAVTPLLGLALNFTPWGIRLVPILLAVGGFVVAASLAAAWRRARLAEDERPVFAIEADVGAWRTLAPLDKALTVALALSVLAAGGALAYVLATPREGEAFTEFYILGPGGKAADYPTNLTPGATGLVRLGIVNHENAPAAYRWEMVLVAGARTGENETFVATGETLLRAQDVTLADEETREENVTFDAPAERGLYKLEWRLHKGEGAAEPYRRLHLWVDVA